MKTLIGPTFGQELIDAGLAGKQISWGEDGDMQFGEGVTLTERKKAMAVLEKHDAAALVIETQQSPVDKLSAFIKKNPDVAALLNLEVAK